MTAHTAHSVVDWTHYLTHAEVDALQDLARSLQPSPHVVNIGAGNGTSGLAFMESRPDLHLYTIDIQLESSPLGCLQGEQAVFQSAGFWGDPRHTQIHGDSVAVGKEWPTQFALLLDMVFVDGGHQYHECKADIEMWLPLVKPGGLFIVHDYKKNHKIWHGVDQAVSELLIGKYEEVLRVDTTIAIRVPSVVAPAPPAPPAPRRQTRQPRKKGAR